MANNSSWLYNFFFHGGGVCNLFLFLKQNTKRKSQLLSCVVSVALLQHSVCERCSSLKMVIKHEYKNVYEYKNEIHEYKNEIHHLLRPEVRVEEARNSCFCFSDTNSLNAHLTESLSWGRSSYSPLPVWLKRQATGGNKVPFLGENPQWPIVKRGRNSSAFTQPLGAEWSFPALVQTICTPVEEKIKFDSGTKSGGLTWFALSS